MDKPYINCSYNTNLMMLCLQFKSLEIFVFKMSCISGNNRQMIFICVTMNYCKISIFADLIIKLLTDDSSTTHQCLHPFHI